MIVKRLGYAPSDRKPPKDESANELSVLLGVVKQELWRFCTFWAIRTSWAAFKEAHKQVWKHLQIRWKVYVRWLQRAWQTAPDKICQAVFIVQTLGLSAAVLLVVRAIIKLTKTLINRHTAEENGSHAHGFPVLSSGYGDREVYAMQFVLEVQAYLAECSTLCSGAHAREATECDCCSICIQDFEPQDQCRQLQCGHVMHVACADIWLCKKQECPMCRQCIAKGRDAASSSEAGDEPDSDSSDSTDEGVDSEESAAHGEHNNNDVG